MASAEDLKDKISGARFTVSVVMLFCLLATGSLSFAREKIFVAGGGGEWTSRLVEALGAVETGNYSMAARVLQELVISDEGGMIRMPVLSTRLTELKEMLASDSGKNAPLPAPRARAVPVRPGQFGRRPSQVVSPRETKEWGRYLSVSRAATLVLGRLPEAGLARYRELYGEAAGELLREYEETGDPRVLQQVCRFYGLTESGLFARELNADLTFESGRFKAAWVDYRSVLADRARGAVKPGALMRLVEKSLACLKHAGFRELFSHEKDRLDKLVRGAGEKEHGLYLELLKKLDKEAFQGGLPASAGRAPASYWGGELPGGATSPRLGAGGLPDLPGGPMEISWISLDDELRKTVAVADDLDPLLNNSFFRGQLIQPKGIDYPFVPLVRKNSVFVSGVYSIYEIDGRPGVGKLLRTIEKPTPAGLRGRYREQSDSSIYAVTLWARGLEGEADRFSGLGELPGEILLSHYIAGFSRRRHYMGYDITVSIPTRSLAAFDGASGDLLWRTEDLRASVQKDIYGPNEIPAEISYSSPALVRDGLVFAGGWKQEGYINSLLRALDLKTGKTVWEATISSSQMEQTMFGELGREPFASFLLEEDGVLYYLTNLGAVAAIESRSGRVLWVTAYDDIKPPPTMGRIPRLRELYWGLNSPLLLGNVLIAAPRDSQYLLAIDTGKGPAGPGREGEILWAYDNSGGDLRDLLGAHNGRLYFSGRDGIFALDITELNAAGDLVRKPPALRAAANRQRALSGSKLSKVAAGNINKLSGLPKVYRVGSPLAWQVDSIRARGLLTSSGVLYAGNGQLETVDFGLSKRNALLPKGTALRGLFSFGGVYIGGGQIILSSQTSISAFSGPTF